MSEIVAMIAHMEARGIECRVILEAVKALSAAKEDAIEERRAADRVRKARQRTAQREALKAQVISHVTPAESTDSADTETPSPLVSPLPSPKPPTNPPIIPPSTKSQRAERATRLSEFWEPTETDRAFAADEGLNPQETDREADKFRDYWRAQPEAKARKLDWNGTWRNWIRRAAPEVVRARSRAAGGAQRPGYGKPQSQFAPAVSLHDALALAGLEAGDPQCGAGWEPDHGNDPDPQSRPPRLEVIDSGDVRRPVAGRSEGDNGHARQTVLALPLHAVR